MTRLYHLTDNATCRDLGIVSRYNVRAVLCDEYDTTAPGVIDAIGSICAHLAGFDNWPEYGCDVLSCMYTETTIDEVEDMAIGEVRQGAYIAKTNYIGHPLALVGFSCTCRRALQAAFCGYDVLTDITGHGVDERFVYDHLIESVGLDDDEVRVLNHIIGNQCKC